LQLEKAKTGLPRSFQAAGLALRGAPLRDCQWERSVVPPDQPDRLELNPESVSQSCAEYRFLIYMAFFTKESEFKCKPSMERQESFTGA